MVYLLSAASSIFQGMSDGAAIVLIVLTGLFVVFLAVSLIMGYLAGRRQQRPGPARGDKVTDTVRVVDPRDPLAPRFEASKLDVDDRRLLALIYEKNIARYGVSKRAFLNDPEWAQAELRHARERIGRLNVRLNSTQNAMDVYFGTVSADQFSALSIAPRLKNAESSAEIRRSITDFEDSIRDLPRKIAGTGQEQFDEIRRIIHNKETELAHLRMELASVLAKEKDAEPVTPYRAAIVPEPVPKAAPVQEPPRKKAEQARSVLFNRTAPAEPPKTVSMPVTSAPHAPAAAPISGAAALEPAAELKALLTVVNAIGVLQQAVPAKISALAKKSERKRIEMEDMKKLLLSITGNAMEAYGDRIGSASDYLDGLILLGESIAYEKVCLFEDVYRAKARIAELAKALGYDYAALLKVEEQLVHGGVLAAERAACADDLAKLAESAKNMHDVQAKALGEKFEREKLFYGERRKLVLQFLEANERKFVESNAPNEKKTAFIRKEFLEQIARMEDNRREFYVRFREFEKRLPRNDYAAALRGLKAARDKAGALYFVSGEGTPPDAGPSGWAIGANQLLRNETALLADGSVLDALGEVAAPARKLPDDQEDKLLRAKMAEREARAARQIELLKKGGSQPEKESIDEAIFKIESKFGEAVRV
ncbi:hypothetical protein FACS1894211_01270 [Clostridia bacterium]|nr:hypothetical protein FACS1894211_01270 [Clostridia bacterium]